MPFNPNSFNYRNVFKDDAIMSSITGGGVQYVSNRIGIAPAWVPGPIWTVSTVTGGWVWGRATLYSGEQSVLAKLAERTDGRFTVRDTLRDPPDVPELSKFTIFGDMWQRNLMDSDPRETVWEQNGPWHHAKSDMYLDPVTTWRSTKGLAIMGVEHLDPGTTATLRIVRSGHILPSLREGEAESDWISQFDMSVTADEAPVYMRIAVDTHKLTATFAKSHTENGRPYMHSKMNLYGGPGGLRDVPVWPVWEVKNVAGGDGYDGGLDTLPTMPPDGTSMTLRLPYRANPDYTYYVNSGDPDSFVNIDAEHGPGLYGPYEGTYGFQTLGPGTFASLLPIHTPFPYLDPVWVRPGDAVGVYTYIDIGVRGGWLERVRAAPVQKGGASLNLLVWRNIGGALATGDAVHGTLPHRQPVVAPPQSPETVQVPPLTAVAPGGAGIGVIAIDPYGVPLGPVGNRGVLPV